MKKIKAQPRRPSAKARPAPRKKKKKPSLPKVAVRGPLPRALSFFQKETDQSLLFWAAIALLNFSAQIIFRHELAPGAFGRLNTALGIVGLVTVPALSFHLALTHYLAQKHAPVRGEYLRQLRASASIVVQTFAWISVALSFLLLPLVLPMLGLRHFPICLFTILNVLIATGSIVSAAICQSKKQLPLWTLLLVGAAVIRLILGGGLAWWQPWAESVLAAFLLAGLITLIPTLRQIEVEPAWTKTWQSMRDRDFLIYLGATFSVVLALFLFSSADRIVAQSWFGSPTNNNLGFVNWVDIDGYQTAGLLGRGLLWGTQPLLLLLFAQRSRLHHTTLASLKFFWIYLGALLFGALLLGLLGRPLSWIFCGADYQVSAGLVPTFAMVMVPLGLLQALAIFSLASRRYPECFVLGVSSVAYLILLYNVGRRPELMLAYMFGGALCSLMMVLFVGVVRWGRQQP